MPSICHKFLSREPREVSGCLKDRERYGTGDEDEKSVYGTQISLIWEVSTTKTGLPFQDFLLFWKISSGTSQKVMFHLPPNRNLVFGKWKVTRTSVYSGKFPVEGSCVPSTSQPEFLGKWKMLTIFVCDMIKRNSAKMTGHLSLDPI